MKRKTERRPGFSSVGGRPVRDVPRWPVLGRRLAVPKGTERPQGRSALEAVWPKASEDAANRRGCADRTHTTPRSHSSHSPNDSWSHFPLTT